MRHVSVKHLGRFLLLQALIVLLLALGCGKQDDAFSPSKRALSLNNRAVRAMVEGDLYG